jgi:hypothetical protein
VARSHEIYKSKLVLAGCKLYNKLLAYIKHVRGVQLFKTSLKELLLKGCYYLTEEYMNDNFNHSSI